MPSFHADGSIRSELPPATLIALSSARWIAVKRCSGIARYRSARKGRQPTPAAFPDYRHRK